MLTQAGVQADGAASWQTVPVQHPQHYSTKAIWQVAVLLALALTVKALCPQNTD